LSNIKATCKLSNTNNEISQRAYINRSTYDMRELREHIVTAINVNAIK